MQNFLTNNWETLASIGGGVISGVIGFFSGQKMKKNNEKSAELENLKTVRDMEKQLILDYKEQVTEFRQLIDDLQLIIDEKDDIIKKQQLKIAKQKKELENYAK